MAEVTKQRGKEAYERQLLNIGIGRFDRSYDAFNGVLQQVARRYDLYRGIYSGRWHSFRNAVHIPLIFSIIQTDVARKMSASFGQFPYVEFYGAPEDISNARKQTVLVNAQMSEADTYRKAYDMYLSAELYGTSVLQYGWKYKTERKELRRRATNPWTGETLVYSDIDDVVCFDGPDWNVVDILDCFPQPGIARVKDMAWFVRRFWIDYDELRRMAMDDFWEIDAKALVRVKDTSLPGGRAMDYSERRSLTRHQMDESPSDDSTISRPVEILAIHGILPDEILPRDGIKTREMWIGNRNVLLRNAGSPHGKINLLDYSPMQDPHFFHGPGKGEIAEKMQFASNRLISQKLDGLDLSVDPQYIADRNRGLDARNLFSRTGRIYWVDGPPGDAIMPITPDMRGFGAITQELSELWYYMQQGTGIIEDTVMGGAVSKRQTAREFMGRQQNVSTRHFVETQLAEASWIEPLANAFMDMNRKWLPVPKQVQLAGLNAIRDPVTGMPYPNTPMMVDVEDLEPNYDLRARGSSRIMSQLQKQQNLVGLLQMISANPAALTRVNWETFLRQTFDIFEFQNVDELLAGPEEVAQNMMAVQPRGQTAGAGEEEPARAAGPLSLLEMG